MFNFYRQEFTFISIYIPLCQLFFLVKPFKNKFFPINHLKWKQIKWRHISSHSDSDLP